MNSLWIELIPFACFETLYMVSVSTGIALLLGLPLGIALFAAEKKKSLVLYRALSFCINITRSFPFAILMIGCIPLTKWIVGTSLGTTAAIVPLSLSAAPFLARLIENAFKGINTGLQEAVTLMGASRWSFFYKVLLPESLPDQIRALTLTAVNLIGYSSMAGLIGGGGLGQVALQYGYQRFNTDILTISILCLVALVTLVQSLGNAITRYFLIKRGL